MSGFNIGTRTNTPSGPIGKVSASLFFLIFAALGAFFEFGLVGHFIHQVRTHTWPTADAVIITSRITDNPPYTYQIKYSYSFDGQNYSSNLVWLDYGGSDSYYNLQTLRDAYPPKAHVICFVNPQNRGQAVLRLHSLWSGFFVLLPLVFILVGAGGIYFTWRAKPPPRPNFTLRHPKLWVGLFCVIFFLAGIGLAGLFLYMHRRTVAAQSWPAVPCTILHAGVATHSDNKGTTYSVDVLYRYIYNGHRYGSSGYRLFNYSSSNFDDKQAAAAALLQHPKTVCYVNPLDPPDAVLDRSPGFVQWVIAGISAFLIVISFAGLVALGRAARDQHRQAVQNILVTSGHAPLELKPAVSPFTQFLLGWAVTIFYNGFVSIFVFPIASEWQRGHGEIVPTVVIGIFVLIGLLLLAAAVWSIRILFIPIPHLTLSRHPVLVNQPVEVLWQWSGNSQNVSTLTLGIAVVQVPANQLGNAGLRRIGRFWQTEILSTATLLDAQVGKCAFTIPPESIPPDDGRRVVYAILLDANISSSTLKLEFPFRVTAVQSRTPPPKAGLAVPIPKAQPSNPAAPTRISPPGPSSSPSFLPPTVKPIKSPTSPQPRPPRPTQPPSSS